MDESLHPAEHMLSYVMTITLNRKNESFLFFYFYPWVITISVFVDSEVRRVTLLDQSPQLLAFPCFTVSSWDIWGDIKARGLPSQIPPVCRPGPWLISDKIHPLLSQKTLNQGWRDWLMRGSIFALSVEFVSRGLAYLLQWKHHRRASSLSLRENITGLFLKLFSVFFQP